MSDDPIKDALRLFPYGFYSITSRNGDDVNAMVANWIMQVSFEPRLVAVGLQKTSYTYGLVEPSKIFTINIFKAEDKEAMMPFTKARSKKPEKMAEAQYRDGPQTGCPILEGATAYIEFKVVNIIDIGGEYDIVIGEPVNAEILKDAAVTDILTLPDLGWSYAG